MSKKTETISRTRIRSHQNLIVAFEKFFPEKPIEKISLLTAVCYFNDSVPPAEETPMSHSR